MTTVDEVDWVILRTDLFFRSRGRCEACGEHLNNDGQVHHRQLRSQGGTNEMVNLVLIHSGCHAAAHAHPAAAMSHGWIVSGFGDPAEVPVTVCPRRMHGCTHPG